MTIGSLKSQRGKIRPTMNIVLGLIATSSAVAVYAQVLSTSIWAGTYTAEQADRGKAIYGQTCAACHGPALAGGDSAPALAGSAFLNNWNSTSAGDLFDRIHTTMPVTDPGSLSSKQVAYVEAYIFSVNGFPAGQTPLSNNAQLLKGIKIVATKPKP